MPAKSNGPENEQLLDTLPNPTAHEANTADCVKVRLLESRCRPCVEVLGKPLISCRLFPANSDGYLVERES